jgi:hypothetical protein
VDAWFNWDFTCCHALAASFLNKAVLGQGFVANDADARKTSKYSALAANYTFTPIAVETLGALGSVASAFFSELERRLQYATRGSALMPLSHYGCMQP